MQNSLAFDIVIDLAKAGVCLMQLKTLYRANFPYYLQNEIHKTHILLQICLLDLF